MPVSGYTTVAVDTVNELMYIFWRSDYPDTIANYNVTCWDYDNEETVWTKKTPNAYGAMQGCDYYNGLIYITYGLGTSAVPSGFVIFNSNIDIIGEYMLDVISATEPEGVAINRNNGDMYVSIQNKNVYKLNILK